MESIKKKKLIWEDRYNELKFYFQENKILPSKRSGSLGLWVANQKSAFNKGELTQEKMNLLLEISFYFLEDSVFVWNENYKLLKLYFKQNGNLPTRRESGLGRWVVYQRSLFKKNMLSKERIILLKGITVSVFESKNDVSREKTENWDLKYNQLKLYFKENGKLPTQNKGILGKWVVRHKVLERKNKLSEEKMKLLLEISHDFFDRKILHLEWEEQYVKLKVYFIKNGKLPVFNSGSLGSWVAKQRTIFNKNELSQERINLLLEITPVFFGKRIVNWEDRYNEFKVYFQETNKLPPQKLGSLGLWVANQRWSFSKNDLSQERINFLLEITPDFFLKRKK